MVENGRCRKSKTADVKTADVVENGRCRAKTADVGVKTADVWVKAADVRTKTADVLVKTADVGLKQPMFLQKTADVYIFIVHNL